VYVYAADVWCDSCGEAIKSSLETPSNYGPPYDTNDYPSEASEGHSDSPSHCGAGAECLERVDLADYASARGAKLIRTLDDRLRYVGAPMEELTEYGAEYLRESIKEMLAPSKVRPVEPDIRARKRALASLWSSFWSDYL